MYVLNDRHNHCESMFPPNLGPLAIPSVAGNITRSQNVCRFLYWVSNGFGPKYIVVHLFIY